MQLLELNHLNVTHEKRKFRLLKASPRNSHAIKNLSMSIEQGKTYGLVGESGSGKSTLAHSLVGLCSVDSGDLYFDQQKLEKNRHGQFEIKKDIQMIFQDAYASLNPKKRVLDIISEPILNYETVSKSSVIDRVQDLLKKVGLPEHVIYQYPHQFSGGERQRINIARAIALKPKLIIADEPTSSLDTSTQAHVLNYMKAIQQEMGISYLFISHDLSVVGYMADRIGVLYNGQLVEEKRSDLLFKAPKHDYTKALLSAIPSID